MHLDLSREDLDFRGEVRAFLEANLTPELRRAGQRATSVFMDKTYSLAWQRILHRRGWVAPAWPVRYGGTGWSEMQRYIFAAESARAGAPSLAPMNLMREGCGVTVRVCPRTGSTDNGDKRVDRRDCVRPGCVIRGGLRRPRTIV